MRLMPPKLHRMDKHEMRSMIAQRIKDLREEQHLTQKTFASMANVNRSFLADIEQGNRNFGIDTMHKIVEGFGITWAEFFRKM